MVARHKQRLHIFWGSKQQQINMQEIERSACSAIYASLMSLYALQSLVVLRQQHVNTGICVDQNICAKPYSLYEYVGDFLVTNSSAYALVVLTADCLPIVLYDYQHSVVGLVHAGWKGACNGVALQALAMMQEKYGSKPEHIDVLFGACARSCCYEVEQRFYDYFKMYDYAQKAFAKRDNKLYFDNVTFMKAQLQNCGIKFENIYDTQASCTICSWQYCSFRREQAGAGRQATVVWLE